MPARFRAALTVWLCLAATAVPAQQQEIQDRRMAVTMDDVPLSRMLADGDREASRVMDLLDVLSRQRIPVTGFVNEGKLFVDGKESPRRVGYLRQWISAGAELGNHTFSHLDLHTSSPEAFERDILKGEAITRKLLARSGKPLRYFRHPFLHTGQSKDVRDRIDAFLKKHGYVVAPVTIDNYDYVFAAAYERALDGKQVSEQRRIVETYVKYMEDVVGYYERQSSRIIGREVPQILLLHGNQLNGHALDRVAVMLRKRGYRFIRLDEALKDPVYQMNDTYYGPGGISWLHRWAISRGTDTSVFAGEPAVPAWIEQAAR